MTSRSRRIGPSIAVLGFALDARIVDGEECGTVTKPQRQGDGRWAQAVFTPNDKVESCVATIRASIGAQSATTRVAVNRIDPRVRIDGVSSFA
jgi:hypothetical protein